MQFKFELTVDVDDGMGFDTAEIVKNYIEDAIRNAGDAGITVKLKVIDEVANYFKSREPFDSIRHESF